MPDLSLKRQIFEQLFKEGRHNYGGDNSSSNESSSRNKPSGNSRKRGAKPKTGKSPKTAKTDKSRISAKKQKRLSRNRLPKTRARTSKPSPSQNISKFGGGVKGSPAGQAAKTAGTVAAAKGIKAASLGSALSGSGFLAGINTVPGLALIVGNVVIWKKNIEDIKKIYDFGNTPVNISMIPTKDVVVEEVPPPFTGGQSEGVRYVVKVYVKQENQVGSIQTYTVMGKVGGIIYVRDRPWETSFDHYFVRLASSNGTVFSPIDYISVRPGVAPPGINIFRIDSIVRQDGLPDTGGNPSGGQAAQTSSGGVTNQTIVTNNYTTNNYKTINRIYPTPPAANNVNTSAQITDAQLDRAEPVPQQVTPQAPIPAPAPTEQPASPTDAPPVTTEDPTTNDTDKKPKTAGGKTQTFPATREETNIDFEQIEKERQKHQITTVKFDPISSEPTDEGWFSKRRNLVLERAAEKAGLGKKQHLPSSKITTSKNTQLVQSTPTTTEEKTEEEPKFTPLIVGKASTVTTKVNQPVPEPPNQAAISQCSKGCAGVTPVNGGTGSGMNASNLNDWAIQNPLLLRIDRNTTTTVNTVTSPDFGLAKIQDFASTAWSATRADKLLQVLNTALIINNGLYLSRNIFSTLGDAASMGLNAVGITDEEGNPLAINSLINQKISSMFSALIGQTNYEQLMQKQKLANRFYQATTNAYSSLRTIFASTREIAEQTGVDVAKIGNALRLDGVVDYDAYSPMAEGTGRLGKTFAALDKAQDVADSIEIVTSEAVDIAEQSQQFKEETEEIKKLIEDEVKDAQRLETTLNTKIDALPTPTEADKLESEIN